MLGPDPFCIVILYIHYSGIFSKKRANVKYLKQMVKFVKKRDSIIYKNVVATPRRNVRVGLEVCLESQDNCRDESISI